jgi:hypothetical protein
VNLNNQHRDRDPNKNKTATTNPRKPWILE